MSMRASARIRVAGFVLVCLGIAACADGEVAPQGTDPPSASPSPSPSDRVHYVSEDGIWELFYPKGWFGPDVAPVGDFTNYRKSPSEQRLPIKVDLVVDVHSVEKDGTLDEFLESRCRPRNEREILECKKVEINGRTWAWIREYSEAEDPAMILDMSTIVNGTIYHAWGYVFATSGQEPGIAQIAKVFESLVLHV
jgi:hypothetical protein